MEREEQRGRCFAKRGAYSSRSSSHAKTKKFSERPNIAPNFCHDYNANIRSVKLQILFYFILIPKQLKLRQQWLVAQGAATAVTKSRGRR